jgi:hypothetical protein
MFNPPSRNLRGVSETGAQHYKQPDQMKIKLIVFLLPLVLPGCSQKQPEAAPGSLPQVTFVQSAETREQKLIKGQAFTLLTNKDYAGLEALAAKYRASREHYANGFWKLALVYNGLEPSDDASDAVWQARLNQIQDWIKARPEAVTPRIAWARLQTSYAWKARGSGWAEKVKEANWQTFFARLQKAAAYLEEAKRLKEKCPAYWSSLQLVALGLQFEKDQYNAIFAQAIQDYPDYQYYYNARATYLLPRWNGDEGEWEKELLKSANRIGGEAGDMLYAQVVWHVNHYGSSGAAWTVFKDNKSSWERVDRGFGVILKQFPDSLAAKTERAYLAALAGERGKARRYFLETKGEVDLEHWDSKNAFDKFLKWTFSR